MLDETYILRVTDSKKNLIGFLKSFSFPCLTRLHKEAKIFHLKYMPKLLLYDIVKDLIDKDQYIDFVKIKEYENDR